jgi:hypothetical protein
MLEIRKAETLDVLSLGVHLSQTLPVSGNVTASRCTVVLIDTYFSGCALLSTSRTARKDLKAK